MKSILQSEKKCYVTGLTEGLELHHIYFGTGNRKVSDQNGFVVWLTPTYHRDAKKGVHFNREFDLLLKQECQAKYEEMHSREEFMRLIGRSYL